MQFFSTFRLDKPQAPPLFSFVYTGKSTIKTCNMQSKKDETLEIINDYHYGFILKVSLIQIHVTFKLIPFYGEVLITELQ